MSVLPIKIELENYNLFYFSNSSKTHTKPLNSTIPNNFSAAFLELMEFPDFYDTNNSHLFDIPQLFGIKRFIQIELRNSTKNIDKKSEILSALQISLQNLDNYEIPIFAREISEKCKCSLFSGIFETYHGSLSFTSIAHFIPSSSLNLFNFDNFIEDLIERYEITHNNSRIYHFASIKSLCFNNIFDPYDIIEWIGIYSKTTNSLNIGILHNKL